jgi:hypothetical protein
MKTLVAGWFSFEQMGASAGDLMARDVVCEWLEQAGHNYDLALAPPFEGGVDWRSIDASAYAWLVFVCGPFASQGPLAELLQRFAHCRIVGVNLTMMEPLDSGNPFDFLWERDSTAYARPDIALLSKQKLVPVVGLLQIDTQPEYKERDKHREANQAIQRLARVRPMVIVPIDTRLDVNNTAGLHTPSEVESLIARMNAVISTRLHGMVLALKNGIPVVAIDSVSGGAKITRQAEAIGWPVVLSIDHLTDDALQRAFDYCLTEEARAAARNCRDRAISVALQVREQFLLALTSVRQGQG